ncbi:hypothetical protein Ahy_B03g067633 isoform A [Arachis hypogaea]|uniref:NAD-dependent epimerase/dehydratase domain-containing protein n=1 Tax=Arachis hypogaea TaxID=3818 RepID=A0A445A7F8_ARAHY|nr:hypothetical protein Ahy_B03g067633 isoform A [Arachis hypogaea]
MSNSIAGIGTGNGNGKVVCVTGASGYIASWIVNLLLQRGYTVRATLRDPSNPKKLDHLLKLHGAKERLQIFKADLLEDGSFDSAIDGCDGVFHTASPVTLRVVNDPQVASFHNSIRSSLVDNPLFAATVFAVLCIMSLRGVLSNFHCPVLLKQAQLPIIHFSFVSLLQAELIDPAVKGTLNVLQSCAKSPSVKRVVLTSSISAVLFTDRPLTPDVVVDETWFSDADNCTKLERWYSLSKTLAEDAAWKFANKNGIDMVSILPSMVAGPLLQPEVNESVEPILSIINGAPFPNRVFGWVNVKDVAIAHIQAYEIPTASGRYLIVERVVHYSEHARILHDLYPTLQIKDKCEDDKPFVPTYQVSKEKAESLGIEFTPLEVTLKETVESFREKNIVNF